MFKPVVATEIEFYLHEADSQFAPERVVEMIKEFSKEAGISLYSAEQERGYNQYEVALLPSHDKGRIAADTERFKIIIAQAFLAFGIIADFSAKPLAAEPGSGLHVHVHLEDDNGRNVFFRQDDEFSPELRYAIGGLLELMNSHMVIFAPNAESYLRFTTKANAPTTVSWGTNNRTTAIRLPNKPLDNKHIEHRVAGSDADVADVIDAILAGIYYGLAHKSDPGDAVYGDASLPQYNLPVLAMNIKEATEFSLYFNKYKSL